MINIADIEPFTIKPRYVCDSRGVFYIGTKTIEGETAEADPLRLSDTIDLVGSGADADGNYYRVIQYRDKLTRQNKTAAIPAADIGTNQGWQRLQAWGITILSGRTKRERLADYLQEQGSKTQYIITQTAGWNNGAYILPSGEIIQPSNQDTKIIYHGDKSQAAAYQQSGSLEQWQAEIAQYAAGNSRLCLALGTAFAAPLLSLLNAEAGGFHLYGDSSDGKTTAARVALSVWGNPSETLMTWQGTGLAFSNTAAARNDGLLVLDEINQAAPRVIGNTVYGIMNGINKAQGAKDGGNRHQSRWRVLLLSTGEKTPDSIMQGLHDTEWNAGQAARLPSIPAFAKHGIYDTLHHHASGAELSEHLQQAAAHYHGTAGCAFIRQINTDTPAKVQERINAFMQTMPELSGQARRVAKRFALAAAALELAAPVTSLAAGVGMAGVKQCFDAWLARTGAGKHEDMRIIKQTGDFMQVNADSLRFIGWNDQQPHTNTNHAGYRKEAATQDGEPQYWIIPAVFESEICQSFETQKVCAVLNEIGWLVKPEKGWKQKKYRKGRFYVLEGIEPPESTNQD
ncbi:DUF927 domain-containing protein [Uruburuella testudinis]|uniref:DUF927 domain-containing protein n=1 Tax=Uruburuella testudinis TaxID=1282863 RepID=A0ABY4DW78_9NEIS|nr:DUF927 domain-containing protein [Uruburuella testudinis]UOO83275.1 DUF927 domain-containing protein [Uruburuella testudinis]